MARTQAGFRLVLTAHSETNLRRYSSGFGLKNALPVEYDDRALKSKDSMIAIHRCHRGNGKLW